jgi:release factor glutamine methyltransferase
VTSVRAQGPLELAGVAAGHLTSKGIADGRLEAELLLAHVLGVRRLDLYLQFERRLGDHEVAAYREAIRRRARREPLQYITGEASFREVVLSVDPRVLIPRPETEVLVGRVLEWAHRRAAADVGAGLVALDVGTGSGAIALSLLREGPFEKVVATDVSAGALKVAAANAAALDLEGRLELRAGSVWSPVGEGERFHVIVANPPYVMESARATLMPEVRDHEPEEALFAGADGLEVVREIIAGARSRLRPGGLLALEVDPGQTSTVVDLMTRAGLAAPRVVVDLTGRERVVLAVRDLDTDPNVEQG